METLTSPDRNRLVIEIPVRHGKSFYCSYLLPAWHLMVAPNRKVTVVSYGSGFATEWSSRIRDLVGEWGPQLAGVALDPNYQSRSHFRLAAPNTGELRGLGIGGSLAGTGAHLIIADDLVKEMSEVATEEARATLHQRFHSELLTRLEPGGKCIIVMSRRHPNDLSGSLLDLNAQLEPSEQWHRIKFQAIDDDTGEALWPERYPLRKLESIKRDQELAGTPWIWHSLYQQDPATAAELCEWPAHYWRDLYYRELPAFRPVLKMAFLDPSKGANARKGDFVAMLYGLLDPNGCLWIDDPKMLRIPTTECEDLAVAMLQQHKPDAFGIETNGFQEIIAQNIHRKATEAGLASVPIYPYINTRSEAISALRRTGKPGKSVAGRGKEVDIRMLLTPILARHNLRIRDTPQGRILGQQLRDFPLASHDDGPDALAGMVRMMQDLLGSGMARGKVHATA